MASLGTPSIAGASSAYTNAPIALTASITEKTDGAVLTWEGVGCDLYNAATGGLTGDQDHDEIVTLVFTAEGNPQDEELGPRLHRPSEADAAHLGSPAELMGKILLKGKVILASHPASHGPHMQPDDARTLCCLPSTTPPSPTGGCSA